MPGLRAWPTTMPAQPRPTPTPRGGPSRLGTWAAWLLSLACAGAHAHDTWFELRTSPGPAALWLGTGDRFPVLEARVEWPHLQRHGCVPQAELSTRGAAAGRPLVAVTGPAGRLTQAIALRLPLAAAGAEGAPPLPYSCWASLVPFDIEIEPARVEVYLQEIAASAALRAAWAAEQAAGRPWRERYVKHARIELGGTSPVAVGMGLEAVVIGPTQPRAGEELRLQLLWAGRPLGDQPVEFVNAGSRLGIWRRTDAQGRVALVLPEPGRWMARSTLLRPPPRPGERWLSDFVTLTFSGLPPR